MYYSGFSFAEAKKLPLFQRDWFIKRINEEFKRAREKGEDTSSRAAHQNTPDMRELQGKQRTFVPSKLTRFT